MKTDDLIRALAADDRPAAAPGALILPLLLPAVAVSIIAVLLVLGPRPDLAQAMVSFVPAMRHVLSLAVFGIALAAVLQLSRPEGTVRLWPLALPAAAAAALFVWAMYTTAPAQRGMALMGKTNLVCLIAIPLLSALPTAAIFAAMRRGATTRPTLTSLLIGLAGGGTGAAVYALYCTESSPLFYVTWYSVAIGIVTLAATLVGPRLLRW